LLIIFDLDDTLIETSLSITPNVLKKAFFRAIREGLEVKNIEKELEVLFKLDKKSSSSEETLKKFFIKKRSIKFFEIAKKELFSLDDQINILPTKNSLKVLKELKKFHKLGLVTIGDREVQMKKMKKAGIDTSFFSIIDVLKNDKMISYKKILNMHKKEKILVCGDRIDKDLKPAKFLKFITVHFVNGRGINQIDKEQVVDYKIKDLKEIFKIIGENKWLQVIN